MALIACAVHAQAQQPDAFESLLASAQQAQARSDFQAAAEFYEKAVDIHPEIPELRANLGLMYYQTGEGQKAIDSFRQALRLKPGLFVPNLFLGLEYVRSKRFGDAVTYLKQAAIADPSDVQVQLGLGQAYAGMEKTRLATAAYERATQLAPQDADAWYHLGVSYLEQVEADARVLLTRHKDSGYVQSLMGETFAEQRAFVQAQDAYKKAVSSPKCSPGAYAGYGFVLLNLHDLDGAEREFKLELAANSGSLLGRLGIARLHLEQGNAEQAAKEIVEIEKVDTGFLQANVWLFSVGLPQSKRIALERALEQGQVAGSVTPETALLLSTDGAGPDREGDRGPSQTGRRPAGDPAKLYARGSYRACSDALAPQLRQLPARGLALLSSCAYLTGNYSATRKAALKLVSNPATEAEGLYWETRAVQKLASQALARASATDPGSPKLHVLLGDIYSQQKAFPDAKAEYRKALALRPEDVGALFGLSLALLANNENDEAFALAQSALQKNPDDPELNAVMGEILSNRDDFLGAEAYLKKSFNTKPEYVSRVHALLGNVYAKTNRVPEAIAELTQALPGDKDGSLHYQIARLYLKVGDRASAEQNFAETKKLQQQGLMHATVAMQQGQNADKPH